jgi:hypothetical protein
MLIPLSCSNWCVSIYALFYSAHEIIQRYKSLKIYFLKPSVFLHSKYQPKIRLYQLEKIFFAYIIHNKTISTSCNSYFSKPRNWVRIIILDYMLFTNDNWMSNKYSDINLWIWMNDYTWIRSGILSVNLIMTELICRPTKCWCLRIGLKWYCRGCWCHRDIDTQRF